MRAALRLWPLIILFLLGTSIAVAFALPDGHPLTFLIAKILGGASAYVTDPPVLLMAVVFGLIIRHPVVAIGLAALFGTLFQFFSVRAFQGDGVMDAIVARSTAVLALMAVAALLPLAKQAVSRRRPNGNDLSIETA